MATDLPRRVVVLTHERERRAERIAYQLWGIAEVWRHWGIEVVVARGLRRRVEADVVINHIDLTVVPEAYAQAMSRYPVAINGRALDISKRRISANLLARDDAWEGPVIVKTDRNYGGLPERERLLGPVARTVGDLRLRMSRRPWLVRATLPHGDYPIFDAIAAVPPDVWRNPAFVVERFLPEREGSHFVVRTHTFFGDACVARRSVADRPIVKSGHALRVEEIAPDAGVIAFARSAGLDRGKIDYVEREGKAIVLDVNRTNTLGPGMSAERRKATCERLAPGLRSFWPPRS